MLGFGITAPPSRLVGRTNHSVFPQPPARRSSRCGTIGAGGEARLSYSGGGFDAPRSLRRPPGPEPDRGSGPTRAPPPSRALASITEGRTLPHTWHRDIENGEEMRRLS